MRRWGILVCAFVALLALSLQASAQATINTSEWTAIQLLNNHRVDAGLTKLHADSCLTREAEWAVKQGAASGSPSYRTGTQLTVMAHTCGFSFATQITDDVSSVAASEVAEWTSLLKDRVKWLQPDLTSIGVAKVHSASGSYIWYVVMCAPK